MKPSKPICRRCKESLPKDTLDHWRASDSDWNAVSCIQCPAKPGWIGDNTQTRVLLDTSWEEVPRGCPRIFEHAVAVGRGS